MFESNIMKRLAGGEDTCTYGREFEDLYDDDDSYYDDDQ